MSRYDDIDPRDIDPDTGRPYANYSSPAIDTSFHDHEMAVDDPVDAAIDRIEAEAAMQGMMVPDALCDIIRAELRRG